MSTFGRGPGAIGSAPSVAWRPAVSGSPWSAQVAFAGATDPAVVIVASTGGHYQGVEAFAVTAIRTVD